MNFRSFFATLFLKTIIRSICKVDCSELERVPMKGPGIIIINHINFLDVPLIQVYIAPRKMHGMVKKETWKNLFLRFLLNTYDAIPVYRGGTNFETFKKVKYLLQKGDFICIAPEGTRSRNGILQKGRHGITSIASRDGVPIYPVTHRGGEEIWNNFKHFRRTKIIFKVGKPFFIKQDDINNRSTREEITREIMYQLAELLPVWMRGLYSDITEKSTDYLRFVFPENKK